MSEWIRVDERVPTKNYPAVLVTHTNGGPPVWIGYLEDTGWKDSEGFELNVTHWQPLPDPPIQHTDHTR